MEFPAICELKVNDNVVSGPVSEYGLRKCMQIELAFYTRYYEALRVNRGQSILLILQS
jgi:hypothetical protein